MPTSAASPDIKRGLLDDLLTKARTLGADAADALLVDGVAISHAQRMGKIDKLERSEGQDLGLRVFVGHRQAIVSTTDLSADSLDELTERALAMARAVPEDEFAGIADPDQLATDLPDLDLSADDEPTPEALIERARAAEEAALAVPGITNSEGAESDWSRTSVLLAASNGFMDGYDVSRHSVSVVPLAGQGTAMERDYDYDTAVYADDLDDAAEIGRRAAERTLARLGARKPSTARVPIVFEQRVAGSLIGHLGSAINGAAVARGTSFLKDRLGEQVLGAGLMVIDDPHRRRGLASKPFDGEGVANRRREIVADGHLTTWVLDLRSARQLGLETTGHAARGTSAPPGPASTNLYLEAGETGPEELIRAMGTGFLVRELIGFGINMVTGDYSRGASGHWVENGEIAYPVSEVTIAGNLKDMFFNMAPASDLEFRRGTNAPTVRVDGMTVAGA
ncbi:MAG: TldD/PmbA family protein [Alphaproteobacteria bacterium]|nr:TldD/PmbA family protein [Alphaproteobacteria bacterium]